MNNPWSAKLLTITETSKMILETSKRRVINCSAEEGTMHPRLNSVLKLFLCVSFYRLLRFSWLSCPSFLKSVCFCRINNYRHQGSVPIFLFCYISLPLILLTISLVFIMAMMQNAIISEVSSTQIMRLFCSMNCSG